MALIPNGVVTEIVAAAKALLRLQGSDEDALIARLATTAMGLAEAFCGQALIARQFEDVVAAHGWQRLKVAPVTAILGVTGLPAGKAPFVVPVEDYGIDIDADGIGWVRVFSTADIGRVAVTYAAGTAEGWTAVPSAVAHGVTMLVAHLFDDRERDGVPPAAVAALWRPYRRMQLHVERRA